MTVALLAGAATSLGARTATAQDAEVDRFFEQLATLPDVVISELSEALRKARGVDVELVRTRFEHVAAARLEDPSSAGITPFLGTHTVSTRAFIPWPVARDTAVAGAISYESTTFRHGGRAAFPAERVHGMRLQIALLRQLSKRWRLLTGVEGGLLSDLGGDAESEELGIDDFQTGGLVLFDVKLAPWVSLSFGSAISSTIGVPAPVPVVRGSIAYEGFSVEMTVPTSLEVAYQPRPGFRFGARGALAGNSYHLIADDRTLAYRGVFVGGFIAAETFQGLTFEMSGGIAPWRQLRLSDDRDDEIANLDPLTAPFVRLELDFRL
jgi:hypothetical protein